jgi:hypothetical protein
MFKTLSDKASPSSSMPQGSFVQAIRKKINAQKLLEAEDKKNYMDSKRRLDEEDVEKMDLKKGGSVKKEFKMKDKEGKLMKKEGRGMAKADMQKVAGKAVKGHEKRMHGVKKMVSGGLAAGHKQADGVATKGKTRGMEVKMKKGGMCK